MGVTRKDFNGIYSDIFEYLGEDIMNEIYKYYKGQQVTFPMKLYSKEYIINYILKEHQKKTVKELARELGYSERWIKKLIESNKDRLVNNKK